MARGMAFVDGRAGKVKELRAFWQAGGGMYTNLQSKPALQDFLVSQQQEQLNDDTDPSLAKKNWPPSAT